MKRNARVFRDDTATRLHSLAIHLLRRVRRTDVEMDLSPARSSALSVLVFGGPRTLGELAAAEQVAPPTMTRLIAGLEAEGYIARSADARDARITRVRATAKGRRVLEQGRQRRVEQVSTLLEKLPGEDLETVRRAVELLEALIAS